MNGDVVALDDSVDDLLKVGEVELGRDALGVEVEGEGDEVDVSGALSVAEEAALDTVGSGHESELRGGNSGATVVVGVEGDDDAFTVLDVAAEVLDLREAKVSAEVRKNEVLDEWEHTWSA